MLSTIWSYIKMPFTWVGRVCVRATESLKNMWLKFESWVASFAPGLKTKIVSGLGAAASLAASMQEYMTGLPLDKFVTGTQLAIAGAVLFTLAFWFRRITNAT